MENKVILLNGGRDYDVEPLATADAYLARLLGSESSRRAMFFLESMESEDGDLRVAVFVGGQHVGYLPADIDKGLVATVKACEVHGVVARARGSLSASQKQPGQVIMRVDLADPDGLLTSAELPTTPPEPQTKKEEEPKVQTPEPASKPAEDPKVQAAEPQAQHIEELQALPVEELQALPIEELKPHAPEEMQVPAALPFPPPVKPRTTPAEQTPEVPASIAVPGTGSKAASALSASFEDAAALMDLEDAEEADSRPETDSEILDSSATTGVSVDPTADYAESPAPEPKPAAPVVPAAPVAPEPAEPSRSIEPTTATSPLEPTTPVQPDGPPSTSAPDAPGQEHDWFKSFSTDRASLMNDSGRSETPQPGWLGFKASQKSKPDTAKEGADKPDHTEGD